MAPQSPGTETPSDGTAPASGGLLFRISLALFVIGVAAVVAIFVVAATGHTPGLALYLTALAFPLGFLLGIVSALRAGRRVRRDGQT
ncbi:hypothetical protein ACFYVR_07230 [Rhodococcus sp. NPDC003318]|uniref:hypothetical protein n=1 Tax=Rhodococcus sp. NPDC003318 TaxID=3364503 RepID=UPI0036849D9F